VRVEESRGRSKQALQQALQARGIDAIDFWSSGDPACDPAEFPEAAQLRREILELPCHQSLDDHAIDLVAHAVKQVVAHA
jgi:perosamine synthetase